MIIEIADSSALIFWAVAAFVYLLLGTLVLKLLSYFLIVVEYLSDRVFRGFNSGRFFIMVMMWPMWVLIYLVAYSDVKQRLEDFELRLKKRIRAIRGGY